MIKKENVKDISIEDIMLENQDDVPTSCQVIPGAGEITSMPICAFCKNRLLGDKASEKCKVYKILPEDYLSNHEKRDCKKFELAEDGLWYKYYSHLLKREE